MAVSTKYSIIDLEKGTLDRSIFTDERVYQDELEQIFGRAWLNICPREPGAQPQRLLPLLHRRGPGDRDAGRQGGGCTSS